MILAAQREESLFEILQINRQHRLKAEELEIFPRHQAEKELPQPQLFFAFGFSNTKPDCISDSL